MSVDDYAEIKIAIFQPLRNANVTNEDRRQTAAESRHKLCILTHKLPDYWTEFHQLCT